jgi:hypothetical protein
MRAQASKVIEQLLAHVVAFNFAALMDLWDFLHKTASRLS